MKKRTWGYYKMDFSPHGHFASWTVPFNNASAITANIAIMYNVVPTYQSNVRRATVQSILVKP